MTTLMLGDSLTAWNDWHTTVGDYTNHGIPGDTTYGLLHRLPKGVALHPDRVILMIGINDLMQGIPLPSIKTHYTEILHELLEVESLYVLSVLPVIDQPNTVEINRDILTLNQWLQEQIWKYGFVYVDLHGVMSEGVGLKGEYSNDGVHLTDAGYAVWEATLQGALTP